jgi:choline dehydrogenase-like flavoprotein
MHHDVIIIGGSFSGLSAAMYIARARRSVCIIDTGSPRNRFTAHSHGFFAQDGSAPGTMLATARSQVTAYPTTTFVDGEAIRAAPGGFSVETSTGHLLESSRLVLAFGISDELRGAVCTVRHAAFRRTRSKFGTYVSWELKQDCPDPSRRRHSWISQQRGALRMSYQCPSWAVKLNVVNRPFGTQTRVHRIRILERFRSKNGFRSAGCRRRVQVFFPGEFGCLFQFPIT